MRVYRSPDSGREAGSHQERMMNPYIKNKIEKSVSDIIGWITGPLPEFPSNNLVTSDKGEYYTSGVIYADRQSYAHEVLHWYSRHQSFKVGSITEVALGAILRVRNRKAMAWLNEAIISEVEQAVQWQAELVPAPVTSRIYTAYENTDYRNGVSNQYSIRQYGEYWRSPEYSVRYGFLLRDLMKLIFDYLFSEQQEVENFLEYEKLRQQLGYDDPYFPKIEAHELSIVRAEEKVYPMIARLLAILVFDLKKSRLIYSVMERALKPVGGLKELVKLSVAYESLIEENGDEGSIHEGREAIHRLLRSASEAWDED